MSITKPGSNLVIDYWPLWNDSFDRAGLKNISDRVDVVNIAFAIPNSDGTIYLHAESSENIPYTKTAIKSLRARGKFVNVSLGGATANNWNLESASAIKTLANNIKKFVDDYGLNGVDIDYEILGNPEQRAKVADLIIELRGLLPYDKYLITYAGWSIGAYGEGALSHIKNTGHEHPEWGSNKGIEIDVLTKAGQLLDWVNVMSYDAFDANVVPNFNPIEAINAYRDLLKSPSKVALGVLVGKQTWPSNVVIPTTQVKPWLEYAVKNGFRGAMFWTLSFDKFENTGEKTGAFAELILNVMPKSTLDKKTDDEKDHTPPPPTQPTVPPIIPTPPITDNTIPGFDKLSPDLQLRIINYRNELDKNLKQMQAQHEKEVQARAAILAKADQTQIETLKRQYMESDNAYLEAEKQRSTANQLQFKTFLSQFNLKVNNAPVTDQKPTEGNSGPGTVSGLKDLDKLTTEDRNKVLIFQANLENAIQQMLKSQMNERLLIEKNLASATGDQKENLLMQYTNRNKEFEAAINDRRKSNQIQVETYLAQLLEAERRKVKTVSV